MLPSTQPLKILIVDDHAFLRAGVRQFLSQFPDMEVVGEAATGEQAEERIARDVPDLVLLDWRLPDACGRTLIPRIKRRCPAVKVLVFTGHDEEEIAFSALEAGADGCLCKETGCETLLQAIRRVARGETWATRTVLDRFLREAGPGGRIGRQAGASGRSPLTTREWEVARLVAEGRSNKEIAGRLGISEGTVRLHVSNILGKVSKKNRLQLAIWVHENNLVL